MAWDPTENGGFSSAQPWLPLHPDWRERNVARQLQDKGSILSLYHQLLSLRRSEPALTIGSMRMGPEAPALLSFERIQGHSRLRIILNLSGKEHRLPAALRGGQPLLSTISGSPLGDRLRPDEGLILRMEN